MSTSPTADDRPARHHSHAELIVILGLLAAIGPLSIDTYLPSLPAIAQELDASAALVAQSVSAYFFGLAAGQIVCGPLSDRYGRRPVLFVGLALYLVASVGCVLAPSVTILIAARAVQGLGAASTAAAGRAVIRDVWAGDRAAQAMSFVMMVMAFAPLLAPIIGGQIDVYFGWRAVFWLMLGFALLLVALVAIRLPETNGPERRAGVRVGATFRAYGHVLAGTRAWCYLLCGGLSYATMFGYITGSPFVYMQFFDISPQYFGLFFGLNVIGLVLGNWLNSRYVMRLGTRRLLGIGSAVSLLGARALLGCALAGTGVLVAVVITLFIAVGPVSMVGANAMAGLLNLYPHNAGAASALFGVSQFGFGALAGVLVGVLFTGTPLAMAEVMMIMALGSFVAWIGLLVWRNGPGSPSGKRTTNRDRERMPISR
ncbi:MAG TPA: Bcr/CflA family multidrug efflux MFS transporter [Oleiagrimonas sp.]|nr:Bcr/CflA family multidrug efflux MFS transporter [Oleiagrimonas sp.]